MLPRLIREKVLSMIKVRYRNKVAQRFFAGYFVVKNAFRSDRPITGEIDDTIVQIEQHRHVSSHDIARKPNLHYQTALSHLKKVSC